MKRLKSYFLFMGLFLLFSAGCAVNPHYGIIRSDVGKAAKFSPDQETLKLDEKDYEVLGRTIGKATATNVLGLFASGSSGVIVAYIKALEAVPGADLLIDVRVDTKRENILTLFLSETTVVQGLAIKLKE